MGSRTRNGAMQVSTDTYSNGVRSIALVGVCHVSEGSFWESVRASVAGFEARGFAVQYEMIVDDVVPVVVREGKQLYQQVAELTGLVSQNDALVYPEHWTITDLTRSELMMYPCAAEFLEKIEERRVALTEVLEGPNARLVGDIMRFSMKRSSVVSMAVSALSPKHRELDRVILGVRNEVAARALLSASGDVVSIWGAAHLKGIGSLLRDEGFVLESRVWTTSIERKRSSGTAKHVLVGA